MEPKTKKNIMGSPNPPFTASDLYISSGEKGGADETNVKSYFIGSGWEGLNAMAQKMSESAPKTKIFW